MKKISLSSCRLLLAAALICVPLLVANGTTKNEYEGVFGNTPVAQQTGPDRASLQAYGWLAADGTITATASSGAATLNKVIGSVTSESLTTAAGAVYTLTLTNSLVTTGTITMVNVDANGSTGSPVVTSVTPTTNTLTIKIQNIHATAAFNGAIKINYSIVK